MADTTSAAQSERAHGITHNAGIQRQADGSPADCPLE